MEIGQDNSTTHDCLLTLFTCSALLPDVVKYACFGGLTACLDRISDTVFITTDAL